MDQSYSSFADWLSKFHTWPDWIQALWLVMVPLTVLGLTWLLMRGLRDLVGLSRSAWRGHGEWRGHLVYGVYQDADGRWMVYWHGRQPQEIDWNDPPPELIGRGTVVQGMFRRPEG